MTMLNDLLGVQVASYRIVHMLQERVDKEEAFLWLRKNKEKKKSEREKK